MLTEDRSHIRRFLFPAMMLLSLALGVFISYYFIFVNGLFIKKVGAQYLCYAFILSGVVGYAITHFYNVIEKRIGFFKTATYFNLFFVSCIAFVLYFYFQKTNLKLVIFIAYTWFWLTSNYLNLVFWKIPSFFFDLGENKQYNGWISTGEVVSSIIAYLSVFIFKLQDTFLLTFSCFGIIGFFFIFLLIRVRMSKMVKAKKVISPNEESKKEIASTLWKGKYFRFIFGAIFFSIVIQLIVDYSLLEVTAHDFKDQKELSSYLAIWYTLMRVMEFLLKTLISRYVIKELGLFVGLISIIAVVGIVVLGGLVSMFTSIFSSVLIFATLNKLFERSIFRSVYGPTINILYQAYPANLRSMGQNFADGFGKTIGQIVSGLIILAITQLGNFDIRMQVVFLLIFVVLVCWFLVSRKLIVQYKVELNNLIIQMKSTDEEKHIDENNESNIDHLKNSIHEGLFKELVGINRAEFYSISDPIEFKNRIEYFQKKLIRKFEDETSRRVTQYEIDIINEVLHYVLKNFQSSVMLHFVLCLLQYKEFWNKGSVLFDKMTFQEVERSLLYISHNYASKLETDYKVRLMQIHVYQLYYSKLPSAKLNNELRSLCHFEKNIFSSVISDSSIHLDRRLNSQQYTQLLKKAISQLTYVAACIQDLKDGFPLLTKMLELEKLQSTQDIINILRMVHDKEVFDRIIPMIFLGNRGEEVIASELLELILADDEKIWILPVVREKNNKSLNRKLEVDFPQASLSIELRLLSIIGKNSIALSEFTRLMALDCYLDMIHSDKSFTTVSAHCFSNETYLKFYSHSFIKEKYPAKYNSLVSRTGYRIETDSTKFEVLPYLINILNEMEETIPISILDMFLRCKNEDMDFLGTNDEGYALLQNVFRGRLVELEKCRKHFLKTTTVTYDQTLANAV